MRKVLKIDEWLHQKNNDKVIDQAVQRVIDKWAKIGLFNGFLGLKKSQALELIKSQADAIFSTANEAIQGRI